MPRHNQKLNKAWRECNKIFDRLMEERDEDEAPEPGPQAGPQVEVEHKESAPPPKAKKAKPAAEPKPKRPQSEKQKISLQIGRLVNKVRNGTATEDDKDLLAELQAKKEQM